MELKVGQVVKSVAGHDKGDLLVIAGFEKTKVLVCDGKHRRLEKPKCKNPKHLQATETLLEPDSMATNKMLRKILNKIANPGG
jgi:ribosomal protein L14E/L6E/L27E